MREDAVGQRDDVHDFRAARVEDHDAVGRRVRYCNMVRAAERDAVRAAAAGLHQRRDHGQQQAPHACFTAQLPLCCNALLAALVRLLLQWQLDDDHLILVYVGAALMHV